MKTITAITRTYRGILIFETMDGFMVFGENNQMYQFITLNEAEKFVDAYLAVHDRQVALRG